MSSTRVPFSYYKTASSYVSRVPFQYIDHVNQFFNLDKTTVTVNDGSIKLSGTDFKGAASEATFLAPTSGSFSIDIEFGGYSGDCLEYVSGSTTNCETLDSVSSGSLSFTGTGPPAGSYWRLDFAGCSGSTILPVDSSSWTPAAGLVIYEASYLAFDVSGSAPKSISFTLYYPRTIYLTCLADSDCVYPDSVEFKRQILARGLSFSKQPQTAVTINELSTSGTLYDPCSGSSSNCREVTIKNASLSSATVQSGYKLTERVWISGQVNINPSAFEQNAVYYFSKGSRLEFPGAVPATPPTIVATYNLTGSRRTASQIVRDQHNGSVFTEFNESAPETSTVICGQTFSEQTCSAWKEALEKGTTITGNDYGSGVRATHSFDCRGYGSYVLDYAGTGGVDNADLRTEYQCIYMDLKFSGGDPTTPHYSEPSAAEEGMSAGSAAAIALGVILGVVIIAVVVLIVLGKLVFSHGSDADP
jgi:hypothetical protein